MPIWNTLSFPHFDRQLNSKKTLKDTGLPFVTIFMIFQDLAWIHYFSTSLKKKSWILNNFFLIKKIFNQSGGIWRPKFKIFLQPRRRFLIVIDKIHFNMVRSGGLNSKIFFNQGEGSLLKSTKFISIWCNLEA